MMSTIVKLHLIFSRKYHNVINRLGFATSYSISIVLVRLYKKL